MYVRDELDLGLDKGKLVQPDNLGLKWDKFMTDIVLETKISCTV